MCSRWAGRGAGSWAVRKGQVSRQTGGQEDGLQAAGQQTGGKAGRWAGRQVCVCAGRHTGGQAG